MSTRSRSANITLYYLVTILFWAAIYSYSPILPKHATAMGATKQLLGIITGIYGGMQFLRIPLGIISDRFNRQRIFITIGLGLGTLSALLMLVADSPWLILLCRAIAGLSACAFVQVTVLFVAYYGGESAHAMGRINAFSSLGQVAAMLAGGFLAGKLGNEASFILAAAVGITGLVLSFSLTEQPVQRPKTSLRDLGRVITSPGMIPASVLAILTQAITFGKVLTFALVSAQDAGASSFILSIVTALATLASFFTSLICGSFFVRKFGRQGTLVLGFGLHIVGAAMLPLISTVPVILLSQVLSGLGQGMIFPLVMAMAVAHVPRERATTAMGFFQAIYALGMFAGPWLMGIWVQHVTLNAAYWFAAGLAAAALVLGVWTARHEKLITEKS